MTSVHEILCNLGYSPKDYGTHYRMAAQFRDGSNQMSLAVHKATGRFIDFGGNKQKGSFKELLKLIMGDKPKEIEKYLEQIEAGTVAYIPKQRLKKKKTYDRSVLMGLLPHWDYYLEEGISKDTLKLFEVGLAQSGKLARRYCFPIYNEENEIIGFTGRWHQRTHPSWYDKDHPYKLPKYKHIGDARTWVWPRHLNHRIIEECGEVILIESPNCALHLWECEIKNSLCLFTIDVNPKILKYLLSLTNLKRIIIATNNEPDNVIKGVEGGIGNNAAESIKKKLLNYFDESRIVIHLPTKKDFGEMTREEIMSWHKALTTEPNYEHLD